MPPARNIQSDEATGTGAFEPRYAILRGDLTSDRTAPSGVEAEEFTRRTLVMRWCIMRGCSSNASLQLLHHCAVKSSPAGPSYCFDFHTNWKNISIGRLPKRRPSPLQRHMLAHTSPFHGRIQHGHVIATIWRGCGPSLCRERQYQEDMNCGLRLGL